MLFLWQKFLRAWKIHLRQNNFNSIYSCAFTRCLPYQPARLKRKFWTSILNGSTVPTGGVGWWCMVLVQKPPDKNSSDKSHPDKSPPTNSSQYKNPKNTRGWIFLGLVDPSRKRLASTAYFAIISTIILGAYCRGAFVRAAFVRGAFYRGLFKIRTHEDG